LPEVLRQNGFVVLIFFERGVKHHLPHCHIRWGDEETVVAIPTLTELAGTSLPKAGRTLLAKNLGLLVAKWVQLEQQQQGKTATKKMKNVKAGKQRASRTEKGKKRGRR
jgi:hypothetical protein